METRLSRCRRLQLLLAIKHTCQIFSTDTQSQDSANEWKTDDEEEEIEHTTVGSDDSHQHASGGHSHQKCNCPAEEDVEESEMRIRGM